MYQKVDLNYKSDSSLFCRKTPSFGKPARIAKAKGKRNLFNIQQLFL